MRKKMSQKGTTVVELLVGIAIVGLIAGGLSSGIHAFIISSDRGNDRLTALHDIQNAAYWISSDSQMAKTTDLVDGAPPVDHMTLSWTDKFGGGEVSHTSTYSLSGTELQRDHDGSVRTVARHISTVEFSINSGLITVTLGSSLGRITEERTYDICLRPAS